MGSYLLVENITCTSWKN